MRQHLESDHYNDLSGNPAGGYAHAIGMDIRWQNGSLGRGAERKEPNGTFVETVIAAAIDRLRYYNDGQFRCRENSLAITHLEEALHWLEARTAEREQRGVEGTHAV